MQWRNTRSLKCTTREEGRRNKCMKRKARERKMRSLKTTMRKKQGRNMSMKRKEMERKMRSVMSATQEDARTTRWSYPIRAIEKVLQML